MNESVNRIFEGLNPRQVEAVESLNGPLLVMAGAGSGKTKVLTCRIANLIANGVRPYNILAITFTNKAANEMKTRAERMIGSEAKSVWLSTFHSFCAKILRIESDSLQHYSKNFLIYSAGDCKSLIREIIKSLNLDEKKFIEGAIQSKISMAKNMLMNSSQYREAVFFSNNHSPIEEKIANIYEVYEKRLRELNAMDFDDLLMVTVRLFETNQQVLEKYQEKFKYILVDEYQDTNEAQYKIMKYLGAKYQNVCVVGDADQSIYGWRGADMRNILNFEKDYPNAKIVKLEQNYRSTKMILDAANAVIEHNQLRKEKVLWTENLKGERIKVFEAATGYFEATAIVNEIRNLKREGYSYKDIALLYRINSQSRLLEESFMRAGIPYVIVGGLKFYDRMEIKNILAYLRLIYNPQDEMSLRRIINVPRRGIGSTTIAKIQQFAEYQNISTYETMIDDYWLNQVGLKPNIKSNLRSFVKFINDCRLKAEELSIDELIRYVFEESGYKEELMIITKPEDESRIENVEELINVAEEFIDKNPVEATLEGFLNHISLITDLDTVEEENDRVSLMTIHSAKGLEFPIVFITGFEEGLFPHSRAKDNEQELEEERRACYVAITRAETKLYITLADSRSMYGGNVTYNEPSRFLNEIPDKYLEIYKQTSSLSPKFKLMNATQPILNIPPRKFSQSTPTPTATKVKSKIKILNDWKVGDKVKHKKWGVGIVTGVSEGEINVRFVDDNIGIKKLALQYAPIEKI